MPARVLFSVPTAAGISYLFFRFAIKGWSVLKGEGEEKKGSSKGYFITWELSCPINAVLGGGQSLLLMLSS